MIKEPKESILTLKINGQNLECQWIGERPPRDSLMLVFLHEGLGCIRLWKDFPAWLCKKTGLPGFMFSRAGYGNSDPGPLPRKINFLHQEALCVLPQVLAAAGIRDHIIIGHSDGGSIGIIYAGSPKAGHLRGLITEAAHVFCEPVTTIGLKATRKAYFEKGLKEKLERYHGKNTETAFQGWNQTWLRPRFAQWWNIEKYLKRIFVPVMAIQGRQDPYATLAQLDAMKSRTPDCRIEIIEACCHTPHFEKREDVLELMAGFVEAIRV